MRPFHPLEELLRVAGERLHVPPLSLGKDRIEDQRRLPRARWTRHHRKRAVRDIEVYSLEVVLGSATYANEIVHAMRVILNKQALE
jgi:hypothetical protein